MLESATSMLTGQMWGREGGASIRYRYVPTSDGWHARYEGKRMRSCGSRTMNHPLGMPYAGDFEAHRLLACQHDAAASTLT